MRKEKHFTKWRFIFRIFSGDSLFMLQSAVYPYDIKFCIWNTWFWNPKNGWYGFLSFKDSK